MHFKLPAFVLWCAVFGLLEPVCLEADDKNKNTAEARKPAPEKKAKPAKKPQPKRSGTKQNEAQVTKLDEQLAMGRKEIEKLRDSLHTAQKELAAKAEAIKALETKNAESVNSLKKGNEEIRKVAMGRKQTEDELRKSAATRKNLEEELKTLADAHRKTADELKRTVEAHRKDGDELKKTAGELSKANDELKKLRAIDFNKLAHFLDAERKKTAALQTQLKETQEKARKDLADANARFAAATRKPAPEKKPESRKPAPRKAEPKQVRSQPKIPTVAPIQYDLNSAVNTKERDRVLRELRGILRRIPKAKIHITGYADDTPYRETNDEVGANRAGFLGKYLILKGLPEDQINCRGVGSSRQGKGSGNRKVVIQIKG